LPVRGVGGHYQARDTLLQLDGALQDRAFECRAGQRRHRERNDLGTHLTPFCGNDHELELIGCFDIGGSRQRTAQQGGAQCATKGKCE
jgi:hypothetical protein